MEVGMMKVLKKAALSAALLSVGIVVAPSPTYAYGGFCNSYLYNASAAGISTTGASAYCSSLDWQTKMQAQHDNWGVDLWSGWTTQTWVTVSTGHTWRSGTAKANLGYR
jgi:hypothetical protein